MWIMALAERALGTACLGVSVFLGYLGLHSLLAGGGLNVLVGIFLLIGTYIMGRLGLEYFMSSIDSGPYD